MEILNNLIDPVISMFPQMFGLEREDLTGLANWSNPVEVEQKVKEISHANILDELLVLEGDPLPEYSWPTAKPYITSQYGLRYLNINGKKQRNWHIGIDLRAKEEAKIYAPEDIVIKKILLPDPKYPCRFRWDSKSNTWIKFAPRGRAWTPYVKAIGKHSGAWYNFKHVKAISSLKLGQKIGFGKSFCTAGNYGYSNGSHLHLEIWPNAGKPVLTKKYGETYWPNPTNPKKWMNEQLTIGEKL